MDILLYIAKGLKILLNPPALRECKISKKAKVCGRSDLSFTTVDDYSYLGYQCNCTDTQIGKFCSIGDNCRIGGASHPINFVSSSPVFHQGGNILKTNFSNHSFDPFENTVIENDVWIGANALIKAGVKISTGAVIGMGSVVTHDVGPYEIWAGNPARLIRKRFPDETIKSLVESEWWNLSEDELRKYAEYFNNPEEFISKLDK